ncbi:hypothetical protein DID88_001241 [Monilinia fructigena]|uniref:Calcineurin-like phosphoesterase domain-containing protein n=1 Tax=Monilinia fructigena TaxID=38457 RepID=A0A395IY00_9HELO|nr:hypothetical protein DID88_001241 [Monilinia fructigena]
MSSNKRPSTEPPSIKLPPFKPHWGVSVGGTKTTQHRTEKSISIPSVPAEGLEQATKTVNPFSARVESPGILRVTTPSPVVPKWTAINKPTKSPEIIDRQLSKDPVKAIKRSKKSTKTAVKRPIEKFSPVTSWPSINIPKGPVEAIEKRKKNTKTGGQQPKKSSTQAGGTKDIITPMLKGSIIHPAEVGIGLPILILAGDIGYAQPEKNHAENYQGFLARMCAKPVLKRIFLVAGNRDFWPQKKNTIPGALEILGGFAAHRVCLETDIYGERPVRNRGGRRQNCDLGATLWTENRNRGGHEPQDQNNVQRTARHKESCEFIRQETEKIRKDPEEVETRILIITHMPPSKSGTSNLKYTAMGVRDFKAGMNHGSDVIDGVKGYTYDHSEIETTMPLLDHRDVWIWGHTHWNEPLVGKLRHGGMRFECNQRGMLKELIKNMPLSRRVPFNPKKVIYV